MGDAIVGEGHEGNKATKESKDMFVFGDLDISHVSRSVLWYIIMHAHTHTHVCIYVHAYIHIISKLFARHALNIWPPASTHLTRCVFPEVR